MDNLFNRVARRRRPGQGGFTLIELLVVIAVLAVLALIVIFNVVGVANKGQTSAACTDTKSIQTAVDAAENAGATFAAGAITAAEWGTLVPQYIHTEPSGTYGSTTVTWSLAGSTSAGWTVSASGVTCPS